MQEEENKAIDKFCECYNAVVFKDVCSGYHGKYGLNYGMLSGDEGLSMDLLIHIGEVSAAAYNCKPQEVWRVSEDGELRDTYRKLTNVFEMPEIKFLMNIQKRKLFYQHHITNNVLKNMMICSLGFLILLLVIVG